MLDFFKISYTEFEVTINHCMESIERDLTGSPFLQIFLDMAVLVDAQGEMLDNIESQVIWYFICLNAKSQSWSI